MVVWTDKALEHITEFIDGVREDLYCLFNVIIFLLYLISKFLRILFVYLAYSYFLSLGYKNS